MKNNVFACILAAAHFDSQAVQILGTFPSRAVGRVSGNGMLSWIPEKQTSLNHLIRYDDWVIRVPDAELGLQNICRRCCTPRCRVLADPCLTVVDTPRQGFQLPPLAFGVQSSQRPCQLIGNCLLRHVSQVARWKWRNTDVFLSLPSTPNWHPIRGKSPNTTGVADSRALFRMVSP